MKLTVPAAVLAVLAVPAPAPRAPAPPVLDFSGPPGSAKPALITTPSGGGGLLATWFEPRDSGRFALRLAARNAGRWTAPVTVAESERFFVNWADFPGAVETTGGRWIVYWLEKTAAKSYAYHIRVSSSADRGKSWSAPVTAHSDRSDTEHGFVAMLARPGASGGADLVWLDGRQNADSARAGMALAAGSIDAEGRTQPDALIDARVCDCCQTALARTSEGLIAAYRDRTPEEVRDIAVIRQINGRWTSPARVAEDGWVYRACPVNGPSLATQGKQVAVAWYTGASDAPRVKLAWSTDAGASFSAPVQVDDGSPLGRSEVELAADGSALAIWLEKTGDQAEWRIKRIGRDGKIISRWTLGTVPPTRDAGFTRAVVLAGDLYVAWSDRSEKGGVRIHRLEGAAR